MPQYVDLHLHTNHSDGSDSPVQVVERAARHGLAAIAITDHDTVSGIAEAEYAAQSRGIELVRGTEISTSFARSELHIVGLGIDPCNRALVEALEQQRHDRSERLDRIIARLNELGVPVSRAEVEAQVTYGGALGRVHVARALLAKGITRTAQEAFDKYIRRGRKAYVSKTTITCQQAIDLIHQAGGLAFIAHPGVGSTTRELLPRLLELPFDGIEVYHTKHTPGHVTQFVQTALERDLLISGGSDCHGTATHPDPDMGKVRVPYYHLERIRDALRRK